MKTKKKKAKNNALIEISEVLHPESNFIVDVENMCADQSVELFDAIHHWCAKRNIEIEQVLPLIRANSKFKKRLMDEATLRHCLKEKR